MNVAEPSDVALPRTTAAVFRTLAGTTRGLSMREVARLSGVSHVRVSQVLQPASARGLVFIERHGNVLVCTLNREHLAADAIVALATLRARLIEAASSELKQWSVPVLHASLYGSAARGDGTVDSDLDVLLVREGAAAADDEQWEMQLFDAGRRLRTVTGNSVSWLTLTLSDLGRIQIEGEPIVEEWRRDAIHLAGPPLSQVLRRAVREVGQ